MKKWICLLLLLTTSLGVSAKSVVFTLNDGTKIYYLLSTGVNPILRFKEGRMVVNEDVYEFSDIKNFYISEADDPNAIEDLLSKQNVTMAANTIIIPADAVKDLKVYTIDGKEVKVWVEKTDYAITVHLNELEKGTYVISTGKSSMKVMKK